MERAFELARSGQERGPLEIIARLKREGYETRQIYGPMLFRQLSTLNKAARTILPNTDRS